MWLVLGGISTKIGRKKYYLLPKYFLKCSFTRLLYLRASEMMGLRDVVNFRLQLEQQFKNVSQDLSDPLFNDQGSFRTIFLLFHLRLYGLYWNKVGECSDTQVWFGYGRVVRSLRGRFSVPVFWTQWEQFSRVNEAPHWLLCLPRAWAAACSAWPLCSVDLKSELSLQIIALVKVGR